LRADVSLGSAQGHDLFLTLYKEIKEYNQKKSTFDIGQNEK